MSQEPSAQRTLVKSPPELWAEISDLDALARHLGEFGDIRITRVEPETTVAWEGDRACGTVHLEPSGWGTKVILTATLPDEPEPEAPAAEAVVEPEPEPAPQSEPEAEPNAAVAPDPEPDRPGFWGRMFGRRSKVAPVEPEPVAEPAPEPIAVERVPEPEPQPEPVPEPENEPAPGTVDGARAEQILAGVLDDLGAAHHRPFSRS